MFRDINAFTWGGPFKHNDYALAFEWQVFFCVSAGTSETGTKPSDTPVSMNDVGRDNGVTFLLICVPLRWEKLRQSL